MQLDIKDLMQFCDEKAQTLKNVNTDRFECPYDKCQTFMSQE